MSDLAARAVALRALHVPGDPLVLPNVWDAGGARAVAAAGFPVIATSSAAVADSLGHADGHAAPVTEMLAAAARVAAAVDLPVTVDFEGGYGLPPAEVVDRLLTAGVVGCNLEDTDHVNGGLIDTTRQADYLAAVRAAATAAGVPLVINARVDLFLPTHRATASAASAASGGSAPSGASTAGGASAGRASAGGGGADPGLVEAAAERARTYLAAGADCVYPIMCGPAAAAFIAAVAPAPVNLIAATPPGRPLSVTRDRATAARLGAARVSLAATLYRHHLSWLTTAVTS